MAVRALALFANFFFFAFTVWHFALAPDPLQIVRASAGVALNDAMNITAINAPRLGKLSNFMSSLPPKPKSCAAIGRLLLTWCHHPIRGEVRIRTNNGKQAKLF